MKKFQELRKLIIEAEMQSSKFYSNDNLVAGTRLRKLLQEGRSIAQEIRMEVLEKKKSIGDLRYHKARKS